jgi:hypothetical protein
VNIEKSKVLFFSNGRLPNNIKFNYNDKELKIVAHFSHLDPQISHSYNKIGFTIVSNKSNWHLIDKLCILLFPNTSYMALIPLFTSSFFAILNDSVYQLEIDIKVRMISYWCKLIQGKQSKLSTIAYKLLYVTKI